MSLSLSIYIYRYIYICVCICINIYICVCICINIYIYIPKSRNLPRMDSLSLFSKYIKRSRKFILKKNSLKMNLCYPWAGFMEQWIGKIWKIYKHWLICCWMPCYEHNTNFLAAKQPLRTTGGSLSPLGEVCLLPSRPWPVFRPIFQSALRGG